MNDQPKPDPALEVLRAELAAKTVLQLIEDHERIEEWLKGESKKFADFSKPYSQRMEAIKNELLARMVKDGVDNYKTDAGTAYQSAIDTPKIEKQEEYLDFCLENWDTIGNEMLQLAKPKIDAVRQFAKENEGRLPPGVSISTFVRLNIRKS